MPARAPRRLRSHHPAHCKRMRALPGHRAHARVARAAPARARTCRAGFHTCFACVGAREWRSVPMQSRILALAVAGILSVHPLPVADGAAAPDLAEVVVTATRTEVALAASLFPDKVIDLAAIVRSKSRTLTDLLRGRAGFHTCFACVGAREWRSVPMQSRILALAVAGILSVPPLAVAEGAAATDLDEVVVTATRTEVALADSLFPVQVIDHDEIVRSQARSLTDLLRGRAGIDIGNQGGHGKLSNVFMRGAEADQVLVLIDGVRVGSVSAGLTAFQDLPVDQIDRIEIVRGPRSSLYGSEAIGGGIQIFTRRDDGALSPRMRAGIGSHGLRAASAGIGGGGEIGSASCRESVCQYV